MTLYNSHHSLVPHNFRHPPPPSGRTVNCTGTGIFFQSAWPPTKPLCAAKCPRVAGRVGGVPRAGEPKKGKFFPQVSVSQWEITGRRSIWSGWVCEIVTCYYTRIWQWHTTEQPKTTSTIELGPYRTLFSATEQNSQSTFLAVWSNCLNLPNILTTYLASGTGKCLTFMSISIFLLETALAGTGTAWIVCHFELSTLESRFCQFLAGRVFLLEIRWK